MKIEKMWTKQDIVSNLKKAAALSHIEQLEKMAVYIQQELNLENLKDGITLECYEIQYKEGVYQIIKLKCKYDSETNSWQREANEVLYNISLEEIDNIQL